MEELAFLGMARTVFKVDIRYVRDSEGFVEVRGERIRLFETGVDYVEFLVSPNPGEEARPLRKIASGGEMSRIMLAMKSVLSGRNDCETLVFDEVDAGIGGVTASAVGKKLRQVSEGHQVLYHPSAADCRHGRPAHHGFKKHRGRTNPDPDPSSGA